MTAPTDSFAGGGRAAKLTSGDKWKSPKELPYKLIALVAAALLAVGVGTWFLFFKPAPPPPPVDDGPHPTALSSVDMAGVSILLHDFSVTAHEVRGEIMDGALKAQITGSVTGDGKFGFGTINAANIDASTLLADGVTFIKGSPTFWSALGVQTNYPGWVRAGAGFFGDRIFFPASTVTAALAPVEHSRILGNDYTAGDKAGAVFGSNGLEKIKLDGYTVSVLPANTDAVFGTAKPMFDALGAPADLVRQGAAWIVNPPAAPAPPDHP